MIKLLVVDDEPGVCEAIEKTFSFIGFQVLTATTSKKASNLFKKEKPRIVFLDLLDPKPDGLTLLKEMKGVDPRASVIVLLEAGQEELRLQARQAGADEFILKPFSRSYLRDVAVGKIKELLEKGGEMQTPKILIVDDERDACELLMEFISGRFQCEIDSAGDAGKALAQVKSMKPDVVFLDIKMPGMSGLHIIDEIKSLSPETRVIILSAWKSIEVVNEAVKRGASDYLGKPISQSLLDEKLRSVLISIGKLIIKED